MPAGEAATPQGKLMPFGLDQQRLGAIGQGHGNEPVIIERTDHQMSVIQQVQAVRKREQVRLRQQRLRARHRIDPDDAYRPYV